MSACYSHGQGGKEIFTKLISISMGKHLIVRDRSGFLTIIAVVIRDEISNDLSVIIFFMELCPHMLLRNI
jgi:hypothetical protein